MAWPTNVGDFLEHATHVLDGAHHLEIGQAFQGAINERYIALSGSAMRDPPADGDSFHSRNWWWELQNWIELNYASFCQRKKKVGDNWVEWEGPAYYTGEETIPTWGDLSWALFCESAGCHDYGFRQVQGNDWPADWRNLDDAAYTYGKVEAPHAGTNPNGDMVGPWIFDDLYRMLNELVWTPKTYTVQSGPLLTIKGNVTHTPPVPNDIPDDWSGATTYAILDTVLQGSDIYISLQDNNLNHSPPDGAWWVIVENLHRSWTWAWYAGGGGWATAKGDAETGWPDLKTLRWVPRAGAVTVGSLRNTPGLEVYNAYMRRTAAYLWIGATAIHVKKDCDFYAAPNKSSYGVGPAYGPKVFDDYEDPSNIAPHATKFEEDKWNLVQTETTPNSDTVAFWSTKRLGDPDDYSATGWPTAGDSAWCAQPGPWEDYDPEVGELLWMNNRGWEVTNDAECLIAVLRWNVTDGFTYQAPP